MDDLDVSLCSLIVAEECNVELDQVIKADVLAVSRSRLAHLDQAYFGAECIGAANALFVAAQADIDLVACWGGGLVASADGLRFVVVVRSVHSGPSPGYFGLRNRGATWLNVVND